MKENDITQKRPVETKIAELITKLKTETEKNNYDKDLIDFAFDTVMANKEEVNEEKEKLFSSLINYLATMSETQKNIPSVVEGLQNYFETVKFLFNNTFVGSDDKNKNIPDLIKLTIIMRDREFFQNLADDGYNLVQVLDHGRTTLHLAVEHANSDIMIILLTEVLDMKNPVLIFNDKDDKGFSPLTLEALENNLGMQKLVHEGFKQATQLNRTGLPKHGCLHIQYPPELQSKLEKDAPETENLSASDTKHELSGDVKNTEL